MPSCSTSSMSSVGDEGGRCWRALVSACLREAWRSKSGRREDRGVGMRAKAQGGTRAGQWATDLRRYIDIRRIRIEIVAGHGRGCVGKCSLQMSAGEQAVLLPIELWM